MFLIQKYQIYHGEFDHVLAPSMVYRPLDVLREVIELFDFELSDVCIDRELSQLETAYKFSLAAAHNDGSSIRIAGDRAFNCSGIACWFKVEDEFLFLHLVRAFKEMGDDIPENTSDSLDKILQAGFTSEKMQFALDYIKAFTDKSE